MKNNNFDEALEIFSSFADFEVENIEHSRYIETLIASHHDDTALLSRLEHWRKSRFTPHHIFFHREIELLTLVPDWEQIGYVAEEGSKYFPHIISFALYKIWSLEQSRGDIRPHLTPFFGKEGLPEDFILMLAQTAFRVGLTHEAIELLFPYALNRSEYINARQMYFHIFSTSVEEVVYEEMDTVKEDCWTWLHSSENKQWVRVTPQTSRTGLSASLIGKTVGDTIEEHRAMGNRIVLHTIAAVEDKYRRLYHDIREEITENKAGYSLESIILPETNVENINKILVEQFGEQGEELEAIKDNLLESYDRQRVSFTKVVRACGDDPVSAYYWLTGYWGKGFMILPKRVYGNLAISSLPPDTIFVLDFTSVLLFFELSKNQGVVFPQKFLVSPFLVEILKLELCRIERQKSPEMSLHVTRQGVKIFPYPENYRETQLDFYHNLLVWIDENCIAQPNRYKLKLFGEALHNIPQKANDLMKDAWQRYALDTMLLTDMPGPPAVLISDDILFFSFFQGRKKLISSELYLNGIFQSNYENEILPSLLKRRYRNLTVTETLLENEFQKFLKEEDSLYIACINNIKGNLPLILQHLLSIYSTPLKLLDQKRMLSQRAIEAFTSGLRLPENLYQDFVRLIRLKFRFLPDVVSFALEDLNTVCGRGGLGGLFSV